MENYLKLSLALKDPNLEIDPDFTEISTIEYRNDIKTLVWHLKTSPQLHCPVCGFVMSKNGFKLVQIKHDHTSDHLNILSIKKQKYICSNCRKTSLAPVLDVRPNDHIALCVKQAIASESTEAVSKKYIGQRYFVSANTVERASNSWFNANTPRFTWLPQNIAFDDFKSGKFAHAAMSIVLVDIQKHRILDIIKDRNNITNYFFQYSSEARSAVKTVTVDLFTPYRKAIHELFPNAVIIADRFHVVTQAYRALNIVRISVMKHFKSDTREYRQLKKFHRLLLKDSNELDFTTPKKRNNYRYAYLTDSEVVDHLLTLSNELRNAYDFYQDILFSLKQRDSQYLATVLTDKRTLPTQMLHARKTIKNAYDEILNSFDYGFSNGPVEGINNKIKVINRISYGFQNFESFRKRILIAFKNSFFAMNYKKATSSNLELVA